MKRLKGTISGLVLAAMLALGVITFTSCTTAPTTAYKASRSASITVETALGAWDGWVAAGKATIAQEQQVKSIFQKYQAAQLLLLDSAIAYKQAQDAGDASGENAALARVNAATAGASGALADLVGLIRQFGVTL